LSVSLTPEQCQNYWRDGFLVVRNLFTPTELEPWLRRVRDLSSRRTDPAPNMKLVRDVMYAKGVRQPPTPEHEICKINFFENDPELRSYADAPRLLDCIESLLGADILFVNSMVVTKPPGVDGRHPMHQDLLYFGFRPGDRVVGTWTALEDVTRENGCLAVIPGSHQLPLLDHADPDWEHVNLGFVGVSEQDAAAPRQHVEMKAGDTLLFHSLLLHGSGTNSSQGFRRAISAHYADANCEDQWNGEDLLATRPWLRVRTKESPGSSQA
jgi:phytanoyl-CoA hydroxylase